MTKMKYRIISGCKAIESAKAVENISAIYNGKNLLVEAHPNNIVTLDEQGRSVICIGEVMGRLSSHGEVTPIKSFSSFIKENINQKTLFQIVNQLEGRFLLILIESDEVTQICADKFSKLDIYIQKNVCGVTLSSDLSLLPENPSKDGYDQNALAHMLTYYGSCPPKKHTIYQSVRRLGVGEVAILDNGKITTNEQDFVAIKSTEYSDSDHKKYTDIFLNHLKVTGSSNGNVVYLSSGWDSTSILAGLVHIFGAEKVRAVTGIMRYSDRSGICNQPEVDKVKKITQYFGVKLDFVDFEFVDNQGIKYAEGLIPTMKNHQLYSFTAHTHGKLAEKTREIASKDEVVFAGEISDGAHNLGFSQYATIFHPSYGFREYADKMASYLFGPTFLSLLKNNQYLDDPIYNLFLSTLQGDVFDEVEDHPHNCTMQLFTSFFLRNKRLPLWSHKNIKLLTSEGAERYTKEMQDVYLESASKNARPENLYSWYLHLYNSFHWQGGTVRSLQVMADKYGLTSDLPFWSANMQDFLSAMPEEWGRGLDLNSTKYPLKNMLKNKIDYPFEMQKGPHAYTYDTDHSFNHMEEVFLHSKMKPVMQKVLLDKPYKDILSPEMFDLIYIDNLVDKYLNDKNITIASLGDLGVIAMLCYVGWYKSK